ncbi:T6SS immunity protein Tdi1 domain-containing protein, partial [Vibrio sp. JPW-9-11-11]|uniref:T6SS immunity protein Tdi1 domain-containing protein n=1 Tax=Vibrio sp. JPW-9-11-11 TaxID=1416532 RepID=UPI001C3C3352
SQCVSGYLIGRYVLRGEFVLLLTPDAGDICKGLATWNWLDFSEKTFLVANLFGDMFFESNEGIYFFDMLEGTLTVIATDKIELQSILNTKQGQKQFLMVSLVTGARDKGLMLSENECYDFIIPPCLGGELSVGNLQVLPFRSKLEATGAIYSQIKDLPIGTEITSVELART